MSKDIDRLETDLLNDLPIEIWTESDIGQVLLSLSKRGLCNHIRLNSTLGRFETPSPRPSCTFPDCRCIDAPPCPRLGVSGAGEVK